MRGTSIFALPGLLIGAALATTEETKTKQQKTLLWRLRYQFIMWRIDYDMRHFDRELKAGKYKVARDKDLESLEAFTEFLK